MGRNHSKDVYNKGNVGTLVHDGWMKWTQNRKNNGKQISSHENKLLQNFKSLRNLLLLTLRISNFALLLAYRPMAYEYVRGLGDF